jgi:hypothetical protein
MMREQSTIRTKVRLLLWVAGFLATTCVAVMTWSRFVPSENLCPDFMQFWTAAELLASGRSPYDAEEQARVQRELGWDRGKQGLGTYNFLPYYYPPWLGLACTVLLPLGYPTAKAAWLVLNFQLLMLSGYHLGLCLNGVPRWIALVAVPSFCFALFSVVIGQTAPLLLFVIVVAWRLLEARRDYLAGAALALALTKPQIGVVVVGVLLLWAARQRRWPVLVGFFACLPFLCLFSFAVLPDWPWLLLQALDQTPLVTQDSPWLSVTWWAVLKTLELPRFGLLPVYIAVAGTFLLLVLRKAWSRQAELGSIVALAIPTTFMVVPYARMYDLTILIIPLLLLLPGRLMDFRTAALFLGCMLFPFVQLYWVRPGDPYRYEVSFFWMPVLLALVWSLRLMAGGHSASVSPSCQRKATVA